MLIVFLLMFRVNCCLAASCAVVASAVIGAIVLVVWLLLHAFWFVLNTALVLI